MVKKYKHLATVLGLLLFPIMMFSGCLKEGDDTLVLPIPDGKIPYSVIPKSLQDSLTANGFVIFEGMTPPTINGTYLSSPMNLDYASDSYQNLFYDLYMTFSNQTARGKVRYSESQRDTINGTSFFADVIGTDSNFTMYCYQNIASCGNQGDTLWRCTTATIVSGQLVEGGIKNCQYSNIVLDKWAANDYFNSQMPDEGTFRIWSDGDSLARKISNK